MRQMFPGYYRRTEEELSELWGNCIFVLDANVLLSLYQFSPEAARKLEEVLTEFCDRDQLWVPHQAALEYQRNRRRVIEGQVRSCDSVKQLLDKTQRELRELCGDQKPPYPEGMDGLLGTVETAFKEIIDKLEAWKQERLSLLEADHIRDSIDRLLEGRIGSQYAEERLQGIYDEAEVRYRRGIPPGYNDVKKAGSNTNAQQVRQYGDVVVWFQVIDHAKETEKPVVFVTNEGKEDWWEKTNSGRIVGPRPELIHEMYSKAGVSFYIYRIEPFIKHAAQYLELEVGQEVMEEAGTLERQADKKAQTLEAMRLLLKDPYYGLLTSQDLASRLLADSMRLPDTSARTLEDLARESLGFLRIEDLVRGQRDELDARIRAYALHLDEMSELPLRRTLADIERQARVGGVPGENAADGADQNQSTSPGPAPDEPNKEKPCGPSTQPDTDHE